MKTITDFQGIERNLSDEIYEITETVDMVGKNYSKGSLVWLISGVDDSDVPGYHFSSTHLTTCSIFANVANFVGIPKKYLKLWYNEQA